jgi:hypothetical protein
VVSLLLLESRREIVQMGAVDVQLELVRICGGEGAERTGESCRGGRGSRGGGGEGSAAATAVFRTVRTLKTFY